MDKLKYLNTLDQKELKAIATKLGFVFHPNHQVNGGHTIYILDDMVVYSSWRKTGFIKGSYSSNLLYINDFEIIKKNYFIHGLGMEEAFSQEMLARFKDTDYETDLANYNDKKSEAEALEGDQPEITM